MSTRRLSCPHDHWNIHPGMVITCQSCGETIDPEELSDMVQPASESQPVYMTRAETTATPLTYTLGERIIAGIGGSHG